jgi:membrane protein
VRKAFAITQSWRELIVGVVRETLDDDCLSLAAQMAFYFFLALFPAVLFLLALASFFPLHELTEDVGGVLGPLVSPAVLELIQDQMRRLAEADSGGLLTFGVAGALWSSSAATVSVVSSLNAAYDLTERRPWWKVRLIAIVLTLVLALFILVLISLILAGPTVATYLGERVGFGDVFEWTWKILQWPVALALVATALGLVYYVAPDASQRWSWVVPGAVVGTTLWLLSSLTFKFYVMNFADYNATYGAVGAVIVLMLWFYVSGLAILLGAEVNAQIEHLSPLGKNPGERQAPRPKRTR